MGGEVDTLDELLPTGMAAEFLIPRVSLEVEGIVGALTEGPRAQGALVRPLPSVQAEVVLEAAVVGEGTMAVRAGEGFLPAVQPHVARQVAASPKHPPAHLTCVLWR